MIKKLAILALSATLSLAQIVISEAGLKKAGIAVKPVTSGVYESIGPLIGNFDYDDTKSYVYVLSADAVALKQIKTAGDSVQRNDAICVLSSASLMADAFELKEAKNRLAGLSSNAKKDEALYKDGVISYREYQKSVFEAAALTSKVAELESRFRSAGVSPATDGVFTVRAKASGTVTLAPKNGGQKIEPFVPYLKISDTSFMLAYIKVPPHYLGVIKKGAIVTDKKGAKIGVLTAVSSGVDETSASARGVVKVTAAPGSFRAGMTAEFFIQAGDGAKSIMLPRSSVTMYKNETVCFVRTKGGFEAKKVSVVTETKEGIYIRPGSVSVGSEVAVGGIVNLKGALSGMGFE